MILLGLNVTGPNMRNTARRDFNAQKMADAQVVSTVGMNKKEQNWLKKQKYVKKIEFAHQSDVLLGKKAIRVESMPKTISKITIVKGRKPKNKKEIVLGSNLKHQYHLGQKITFKAAKKNGATNLNHNTYKIVGFATSTEYLKKDNLGNTSAGDGNLSSFAFVSKSAFKGQPTIGWVDLKASGQAYSDKYEKASAHQVNYLQPKLNKYNKSHIKDLKSDIQDQINNGQQKINQAQKQVDQGQRQLQQLKQAAAASPAAARNVNVLQKRLATAKNTIATNKVKLEDAKTEKKQLNSVTLTINNRENYNDGYNQYGEDADRISSLGIAFPIFFFLVAILVSFSTMSRMVAQARKEIGTLRALGYSWAAISEEFIYYSLGAAILGTLVGSALGLVVLPRVIFNAYAANFSIANVILSLHPELIVLAFIICLFSTVLASYLALRQEMKEVPAALMQSKAPEAGSRILLERITPIWKRMSFSHKVTARNLFRYKSRMLMTIIGIGGSVALMITGFGIKDSLNTIINRQFGNIQDYDAIAVYNNQSDKVASLKKFVKNNKDVNSKTSIRYRSVYANREHNTKRDSITLIASKNSHLRKYIKLNSVNNDQKLKLQNNGVIVSNKLAKLHNLKIGSKLTIHSNNGNKYQVKVKGIANMYAGHFIYITPQYYKKLFGSYHNNGYLIKSKNLKQFSRKFNRYQAAVSVVRTSTSKKTITNILANLNNLILVIVISSSLLTLVVSYTLTYINVSERERELATLKVLGFYPKEVLMYIFREVNLLTAMGIIVGIGVGYWFHSYIMQILPPSTAIVAPGITWTNVGISVGLSVLFALIIMIIMNRKIQNIDMLGALQAKD